MGDFLLILVRIHLNTLSVVSKAAFCPFRAVSPPSDTVRFCENGRIWKAHIPNRYKNFTVPQKNFCNFSEAKPLIFAPKNNFSPDFTGEKLRASFLSTQDVFTGQKRCRPRKMLQWNCPESPATHGQDMGKIFCFQSRFACFSTLEQCNGYGF